MKVISRVTGIGTSRIDALANSLRQRVLAKLQARLAARQIQPLATSKRPSAPFMRDDR